MPLTKPVRILIVGNYQDDNQQSMIRFSYLLEKIYSPIASCVVIQPPGLFGTIFFMPKIFKKYLAYIDKLLIFPVILFFYSFSYDLVHIADHSNSFYTYFCPRAKTLVTCHDLLAVRGARGDQSVACVSSRLGPFFQLLVLAGLKKANAVAFDSSATFQDYTKLVSFSSSQKLRVTYIPLNANFRSSQELTRSYLTQKLQLPDTPYLLMVGSAQPRKNRQMALQILSKLGPSFSLVFAGESLAKEELHFQITSPVGMNVVSIVSPSHLHLNALYCNAFALLFPSISEGFGWPLIEAQASGCPVIASNATSIPEVAGYGALYSDPFDVEKFTNHVYALADPHLRKTMISKGFENLDRFELNTVSENYQSLALSL